MEGHRLSLTQFVLLAQIAAAGEDTVGGLSARMDLDQSTLSRNLRALEAEGLATIAGVEGDLRIRAVHLTAEGAARLRAALPAWLGALTTSLLSGSTLISTQVARWRDGGA